MKRLTSRRPPLPAGWGLPAVSSAEPEPAGADGADSSDGAPAAEPEPETKPEGVGEVGGADGGSSSSSSPPSADVGWGSATPTGEGGEDGQQGGAVVSSEADALMFGLQAAAAGTAEARDEGRDDERDPPVALPPAPKRAASQDAAVTAEDDDEADVDADAAVGTGGGVVEEKGAGGDGDVDDASTATLDAKIADLTLSADAVGLAGATSDGMMPPTPLPLADNNRGAPAAAGPPFNLVAPTGLRQGPLPPSGLGLPGEPHSPSGWAGAALRGGPGGDESLPSAAAAVGIVVGAEEGAHPAAAAVGDYPQQRGGLNLTPPPWEGNGGERRNLAAAAAVAPSSLPAARDGGGAGVRASSLPSEEELDAPAPAIAVAVAAAPAPADASTLVPDEAKLSEELTSRSEGLSSVVVAAASKGKEEAPVAAPAVLATEKLPLEEGAAALSTGGVKLDVGVSGNTSMAGKEEGEEEKATASSPSALGVAAGGGGEEQRGGDGGGIGVRTPAAATGEQAPGTAAAEPTAAAAAAAATAGAATADAASAGAATAEPAATPAGGSPTEQGQGQGQGLDSMLRAAGEAVVTAAPAGGDDGCDIGRKPGSDSSATPVLAGEAEGKSGGAGKEGEGVARPGRGQGEGLTAGQGRQETGVVEHKSVEPEGIDSSKHRGDEGDEAGRAWSKE